MAVGPEVDQDQLKVGDRVCYGEFDYPEYREDGIRYKVLQDKDIVGVIDEPL
jgi:co-chaperonin GroES (HSP10)